MKKGKVYLVGAGPSDFGLLTLKGKDAIEKADIILYDRLVSHSIVNLAKDGAELVDVGKKADNHTMPQEEINKLILDSALNGKTVVRLKGGDPFLFGRGAEELELLVENDVEFEVINGITSAISVPTYNGIPVTHRDFTSSLHIITGNNKNNETKIDFQALVRLNGTLVFLMSIRALKTIVDGLTEAGMDKNMPVCILEKGTTAKQRRISGTLENIYEKSLEENAKTPGIIIVGKVCSLADEFDFRKNMILSKTRVIVTRPRDKNFKLCNMLREKGAEVIDLPTIKTKPIINQEIKEVFENLNYDYIVFTSPKGVEQFFENFINFKKDIRSLANCKFGVVGNATKTALMERGIVCDIMPEKYCGKELGNELLKHIKDGEKILIARAEDGNQDILEVLNGKDIKDLAIYKTIYEKASFINFELDYNDIVVFTSASTVKGFVESTKELEVDYSKIKAVCIGKQTEFEAKIYNMQTFVSEKATLDSLMDKIIEVSKGE